VACWSTESFPLPELLYSLVLHLQNPPYALPKLASPSTNRLASPKIPRFSALSCDSYSTMLLWQLVAFARCRAASREVLASAGHALLFLYVRALGRRLFCLSGNSNLNPLALYCDRDARVVGRERERALGWGSFDCEELRQAGGRGVKTALVSYRLLRNDHCNARCPDI